MAEKDNDSKRKIIDITVNLIKNQGFDNVTISQICEACQISKNTFYYYFTSKEQLLLLAMHIPNDIYSDNLASILTAENNFEQFWKFKELLLDHITDFGIDIIKKIVLSEVNQESIQIKHSTNDREMFKIEQAIISKAQQSGEIRNSCDAEMLLPTSNAVFFGTITFWCMHDNYKKFEQNNMKTLMRFNMENLFDLREDLRKTTKSDFNQFKKINN